MKAIELYNALVETGKISIGSKELLVLSLIAVNPDGTNFHDLHESIGGAIPALRQLLKRLHETKRLISISREEASGKPYYLLSKKGKNLFAKITE